MDTPALKGRELYDKALKKLSGWGLFGNKNEEAAELLEQAATQLKIGKLWKEAAEAYTKLAELQKNKLESSYDAAMSYVDAAKCITKVEPRAATGLLRTAVDLFTSLGRLNMAARQLREAAEVMEKDGQKDEAILYYTQAADLFMIENSTSDASKCKLKIAEFSAETGDYAKAMELFEEAAKASLESNLLKYSAKGHLLNAGICAVNHMDPDDVKAKVEDYRELDLNFGGSREEKLLNELAEAMENQDDAAFAAAVADYDSMTRLDQWRVKRLLEAKRKIQDLQMGVGSAPKPSSSRAAAARAADDDDLL